MRNPLLFRNNVGASSSVVDAGRTSRRASRCQNTASFMSRALIHEGRDVEIQVSEESNYKMASHCPKLISIKATNLTINTMAYAIWRLNFTFTKGFSLTLILSRINIISGIDNDFFLICGLQLPNEPHRSTRLFQLTGRSCD